MPKDLPHTAPTGVSLWFARALLVIAGLYTGLQSGLSFALYIHSLQAGHRFGGDFICFWEAGQRLRAGAFGAIYDPAGWTRALTGRIAQVSWFVYPPFSLFGLQLLGSMTYRHAVAWWSALPLPLYIGLLLLLLRRSEDALAQNGASSSDRLGWLGTLILILMTSGFLTANLLCGQVGTLIAVLWLAAAWFWPNRPLVAGAFIGLIAVKPQVGLLIPVALVSAGRWRTIVAATATIAALGVGSLAWVGAAVWRDYLQLAQLFGRYIGTGHGRLAQLAVAPYVSLRSIGLPMAWATLAQVLVSVTVVIAIGVAFRPRIAAEPGVAAGGDPAGTPFDLRLAILATGGLLFTPYALSYDTPLLALGLAPLFVRAWRGECDGWELAALTALAVTPYMQQIAGKHLPFGLCATVATFVVLARRYMRESGLSHREWTGRLRTERHGFPV